MGTITIEEFKTHPGWTSINAVENDRIHEIDEDLVLRPGPLIIDGLEQLPLLIHPELFTGIITLEQDILLTTNSSVTGYIYDDVRKLIDQFHCVRPQYDGRFFQHYTKENRN